MNFSSCRTPREVGAEIEIAAWTPPPASTYQLGPEAVVLGATMVESPRRNFPRCAEGVLGNVSRSTGETVYLAVLTPDRMQCKYVSMVEADHWLRFTVKLGSHKPAYATGSGRAMLAFLPQAQFLPLLDRFSFERLTPRTVSSRSRLLTAIKAVRRLGVSTVDSGTVDGVTAIAAPIFGATGEVVAALTVGGPSSRIAPRQAMIENAARDAAEEISRILGFRDAWPPRPGQEGVARKA